MSTQNTKVVLSTKHVIDALDQVNVSSFLDSWGPEEVIQVYDPNTGMQGFLVIDNTALGPGKGGIRIGANVTPAEVFGLARAMTWKSLWVNDTREAPDGKLAALAKVFASDAAMKITTDAVQVYGGAGYMKENPVEKYMRDAKVMQIYEGTNQVLRILASVLECFGM